MAEACFFLMTARKLFGINLGDLIKLGKEEEAVDWESISSPPFFSVDLPDADDDRGSHHFVFDSKMYVARGGLMDARDIEDYLDALPSHKKIYVAGECLIGTTDIEEYLDAMPSFKIYQFDMKNKRFTGADSIHHPPTPMCSTTNIVGEALIIGTSDVLALVVGQETEEFMQEHPAVGSSPM